MSATPGRHSKEDVVAAALRILDNQGLPELTMRRLAGELDVQPSALYWHFRNKQTLLATVSDRIVARADRPAAGDSWQESTAAQAGAIRDALLAYRDGAEVVSSSRALGLGGGQALRLLEAAIADGGFDDATTRVSAQSLLHFILGHVSHEQQRLQADSLGVVPDGPDTDESATFAFGVRLLINGLDAMVAATDQ
jgi:AcrR family transcriptional regulator